MMNYREARDRLFFYRMKFNDTLTSDLKEAFLAAEEALLQQAIQNDDITYIPPYYLKEIKNDT